MIVYPSAEQIASFAARLVAERPAKQGAPAGICVAGFPVPRSMTAQESLEAIEGELQNFLDIPSDVAFQSEWGPEIRGCAIGRYQDVVARIRTEADIENDKLMCWVDCAYG